jgi:hypothetical protein
MGQCGTSFANRTKSHPCVRLVRQFCRCRAARRPLLAPQMGHTIPGEITIVISCNDHRAKKAPRQRPGARVRIALL